jgi:CBS domain containing-hemolysin-like protein
MTEPGIAEFIYGPALVVVLVLLNGFFVAAEFAIVKVRDTQLQPLAGKGDRRARMARRVVGNLDAALSATQLGITLASLGLGWFAEPVFARMLTPPMDWLGVESEHLRHSIAFGVGFSVITFLHIVAGELAPKSLAIQKPLPTSLWVAEPLHWFYRISYPFIFVLNNTALWLLRRLGLEAASEAELHHSEEELRLLFSTTHGRSGGSALGKEIVLNALDLRQRVVREVMQPRRDLVALSTEFSLTECMDVAEKTRYSRFPICQQGDLDRTLGVVHIKDLYAMRLKARSASDLLPVARKIVYVPESARLERLLQLLLERKLHLAVVVDEYGSTVGMVTLEDILEELVGQIQDEFDQEKPPVRTLGDGIWEVDGSLPLHELAELIGEPLHEEGITTTSGFITHRLGGFPKAADEVSVGKATLRVEDVEGLRVARLRVLLPEAGKGSQAVRD